MPTATLLAPITSAPPTGRDLPVDALRAGAVGVVVVGHALVAAVAWRGGRPVADNLLATSALARALTWVFQVLPLVFLCGGVAAAHAAGR
ncbi:MAG: acyltransferase, partial [Acidimicrobiales bacterium]